MADERENDQSTDDQDSGTTSQSSTSPQHGFDQHERQPRKQDGDMSGQPIGGNDSNTGSGTTLTSGYTPPSAGYEQRLASDGTGAVAADQGRDSATHANRGFGQGTTSNAGGSTVGTSQTSGGSSGVSGGEGFIGLQGSGSDDYLQERSGSESSSSAGATGGSDFAEQGRGALEDEDDESSSGSTAAGA
jgi:hypothetical protein